MRQDAIGWDALTLWSPQARRVRCLSKKSTHAVWLIDLDGQSAVARLGQRSDADVAWEAALLRHLGHSGLTVPLPVPTRDGRSNVQGLTVMTFVEGTPPATSADWHRVAPVLRHLHRITSGWPQRPGWRSAADLLDCNHGTRIDLAAMPPDAVRRCRAAWTRLLGQTTSVVHGNPANPFNICISQDHVALIDWDEARVDASLLDLALPHNAAGLAPTLLDTATQAAAAWEAAICWDDAHARRQLAQLRPA